jgi:hypothetical protein
MAIEGAYDIGDLVKVSVRFINPRGKELDPAAVSLLVKSPDGVTTTYTYSGGAVTRDKLGCFHRNITIDQAGQWFYRFVGTGGGQAAGEKGFYVNASEFV